MCNKTVSNILLKEADDDRLRKQKEHRMNKILLNTFIRTNTEISREETYAKEIFFNWDSLHARLNSHHEAWSNKKKKHKKIKAYIKSV